MLEKFRQNFTNYDFLFFGKFSQILSEKFNVMILYQRS